MPGAPSKTQQEDRSIAPSKRIRKKKLPALHFASWNVWSRCPGLSDDLRQIDDLRKTAVSRLNVDIAALQETRLAAKGTLREKVYTLYWQGRAEGEVRRHGVGFAVRNSLLSTIQPPTVGTERILSLRLTTSTGFVNIMSIYAPTLCSSPEVKDQFYEDGTRLGVTVPAWGLHRWSGGRPRVIA